MNRQATGAAVVATLALALVGLLVPGCSWLRGGQKTGERGASVELSRPDSVPAEPTEISPESQKPLAVEMTPATSRQPAPPSPTTELPVKTGDIMGMVLDQRGSPIGNAHAIIQGSRFGSATLGSGRFLIQDIPEGTYRLMITKRGFAGVTLDSVVVPADALTEVHDKVKDARIFSFGVGSSVNRYLLEGLARLGRGAVAYIGLNESAGDKVDLFYERMSRPALTDVEIDWGGFEVSDVYPSTIPDLFVGRPVMLTGRFKRVGADPIRMSGRMGSSASRYTIPLPSDEALAEHAGIRSVWARWKPADLSDKEVSWPSDELKEEITQTSLQHRLLCQYTSFVAVDGTEQTPGDAVTVKMPSYVPEGVSYGTTVMDPSGQGVPPSKP